MNLDLLSGWANLNVIDALDWAGCITGLTGAYLLASHSARYSKYGWVSFLLANLLVGAMAALIGRHGLLIQQIGFTGSSLLGMYRSGLLSKRKRNTEVTRDA